MKERYKKAIQDYIAIAVPRNVGSDISASYITQTDMGGQTDTISCNPSFYTYFKAGLFSSCFFCLLLLLVRFHTLLEKVRGELKDFIFLIWKILTLSPIEIPDIFLMIQFSSRLHIFQANSS